MARRHVMAACSLFAVSLSACVLSALAFANNVSAIVRWWAAFSAAGGDSASTPAAASGFIPWLDWCAVDYSAVTTLIPLIGTFCMAAASLRLVRGRPVRSGEFPFFRGSDQLFVALGLLGTLWGIIVIGYFRLDTVRMANLVQCLHTALFSTLAAVVWVFVVDHPFVRPVFTRLARAAGLVETGDSDLAAAVDALIERLGAASDAFDRRQKSYEEAFERREAEYQKAFDERQREYSEFFTRRVTELEKRLASCESRMARAVAALREP